MTNALIRNLNDSDGLSLPLDVSGTIDTPEEARTALVALHETMADPFSSFILLEGDDFPYDYCYLTHLGNFKNIDDYRANVLGPVREKRLGPFLASLPASPEEEIPTDPTITIVPNTVYPLGEVWKGLPESVRVFLTGVKERPELAIAYETGDPSRGVSARWHLQSSSTGSGGTAGSRPPSQKPSVNLSIGSTLAGSAVIMGLSLGLQELLPDLKPEGRNAINLSTLYVGNYLLSQSKLLPASSWEAFSGQLPGMISLGTIAALLVHGAGTLADSKDFRFGGLGHELATMGLSIGAFYTILTSKTLSPLLTGGTQAVKSLALLAKEMGLPWVARAGTSGFAPAGGAGIMGGIGQGLKVAGWFGIGNIVLGGLKSLANPTGDDPEKRLDKFVEDLFRLGNATGVFGEAVGGVVDGFLGHLGDGIIWFAGLFSDRVKEGRELRYMEIKNNLLQGTQEFGDTVRLNLGMLIAHAIQIDTGEIDWSAVETGLQTFYSENAKGIENAHKILEYTGHLAYQAQEIKDLIQKDGTFDSNDRSRFKEIALSEISYFYGQTDRLMLRTLREIGAVQTVGGEDYTLPEPLLSPEQRKRVEEEVLPLAAQNEFLKIALKFLRGEKLVESNPY